MRTLILLTITVPFLLLESCEAVPALPVSDVAKASSAVCGQNGKSCEKADECCSGCCENKQCVNCNRNPCALHSCPQGKECYLHQVTCIQAPCYPIPACKSTDYDTDYGVDQA